MKTQYVTTDVTKVSVNIFGIDPERIGHLSPILPERKSEGRNNHNSRTTKLVRQEQVTKPYLTGVGSYDATLRVIGEHDTTTLKLFGALQNAYNYFKQTLFGKTLSPVVLTLNRKSRSMGYYKSHAWLNDANDPLPEININPSILYLPAVEVMQTLVHEMCHHYQFRYGRPGRRGYHNQQFSRIMFSIGLMCSSTGKPGGKVTGSRMSDYAIENGLFLQKFNAMPKENLLPFKPYEQELFLVDPSSAVVNTSTAPTKKNKVKYSCPSCHANAWAKPGAIFICGICFKPLKAID